MKCMTLLKVCDLKIHPDNEYYFDDISGEKWNKLLESIKNNGVRTPIIVTDDMRVVSGNQRVRACKELGIEMINAEVAHYKSEEDIIRDLIEINIRQRGVIDDSEVKAGRRLKFLQGYYGVGHGGDRKSKPQNADLKTQEQIAAEANMSVDTMQRLVKLSEMIPQMQELVETGIVSKTTALAIAKQLPEFQQKELAEQLSGSEKKVSQREVQRYIDMIAEKDRKIKELENREPEVRTVVKEVVPDDYREAKSKARAYDADTRKLNQKLTDAYNEQNKLRGRISELEKKTSGHELHARVVEGSLLFVTACGTFVRDYGGYIWITDHLNELSPNELKDYENAIRNMYAWSSKFLDALDIGKEKMLNG